MKLSKTTYNKLLNNSIDTKQNKRKEIWKDIKGYEGIYQVSNLGRVKRLNKQIIRKNGRVQTFKEKIMKPYDNQNGYLKINLHKNKRLYSIYIHKLVAEQFISNPNNYKEINHKDENKYNNIANNLEWCNHKYNCNYGTKIERQTSKKSKKVVQYDKKMNYLKTYNSIKEAQKECKCFNISQCCQGKLKSSGGYIWKYENTK